MNVGPMCGPSSSVQAQEPTERTPHKLEATLIWHDMGQMTASTEVLRGANPIGGGVSQAVSLHMLHEIRRPTLPAQEKANEKTGLTSSQREPDL